MTQPEIQAAGTYGLTVRCRYRKLFLTPFVAMMHEGILYALARAVRATGAVLQ